MQQHTNSDADARPLPDGWYKHYDPTKRSWYYVQTNIAPPKISFTHPADLEVHPPRPTVFKPSSTSQVTSPSPNNVNTPLNEHVGLSLAQRLYASASLADSIPTISAPVVRTECSEGLKPLHPPSRQSHLLSRPVSTITTASSSSDVSDVSPTFPTMVNPSLMYRSTGSIGTPQANNPTTVATAPYYGSSQGPIMVEFVEHPQNDPQSGSIHAPRYKHGHIQPYRSHTYQSPPPPPLPSKDAHHLHRASTYAPGTTMYHSSNYSNYNPTGNNEPPLKHLVTAARPPSNSMASAVNGATQSVAAPAPRSLVTAIQLEGSISPPPSSSGSITPSIPSPPLPSQAAGFSQAFGTQSPSPSYFNATHLSPLNGGHLSPPPPPQLQPVHLGRSFNYSSSLPATATIGSAPRLTAQQTGKILKQVSKNVGKTAGKVAVKIAEGAMMVTTGIPPGLLSGVGNAILSSDVVTALATSLAGSAMNGSGVDNSVLQGVIEGQPNANYQAVINALAQQQQQQQQGLSQLQMQQSLQRPAIDYQAIINSVQQAQAAALANSQLMQQQALAQANTNFNFQGFQAGALQQASNQQTMMQQNVLSQQQAFAQLQAQMQPNAQSGFSPYGNLSLITSPVLAQSPVSNQTNGPNASHKPDLGQANLLTGHQIGLNQQLAPQSQLQQQVAANPQAQMQSFAEHQATLQQQATANQQASQNHAQAALQQQVAANQQAAQNYAQQQSAVQNQLFAQQQAANEQAAAQVQAMVQQQAALQQQQTEALLKQQQDMYNAQIQQNQEMLNSITQPVYQQQSSTVDVLSSLISGGQAQQNQTFGGIDSMQLANLQQSSTMNLINSIMGESQNPPVQDLTSSVDFTQTLSALTGTDLSGFMSGLSLNTDFSSSLGTNDMLSSMADNSSFDSADYT